MVTTNLRPVLHVMQCNNLSCVKCRCTRKELTHISTCNCFWGCVRFIAMKLRLDRIPYPMNRLKQKQHICRHCNEQNVTSQVRFVFVFAMYAQSLGTASVRHLHRLCKMFRLNHQWRSSTESPVVFGVWITAVNSNQWIVDFSRRRWYIWFV